MASHAIDRIDAEQGAAANPYAEVLRNMRRFPLETEEPFTAGEIGALRGLLFALIFEGICAVICVALFAWIF
jgi:hypothetical protein